ncbi:hypothetical protein TorRG33x02_091610 [Trema orientale]|uniref:Uncharacterized protein n=1 Tax=Trema orientale TaxID=63057 RepID=A0A2P5FAZ1_TREOI|nr:hypothetical protein TorRG33x02_091610 [Trema orientale]
MFPHIFLINTKFREKNKCGKTCYLSACICSNTLFLISNKLVKFSFPGTHVSINPADADRLQKRTTEDPENPGEYAHTGNRFLPENYANCFEFLKLAYKAMLDIFGYAGHTHMIRKEKEKHVWACLVLDELLKRVKMYDNIDRQSGANPGTTNQTGHDDNSDQPSKEFILNPELGTYR